VTKPGSVWITTGLHWHQAAASLTLTRTGDESRPGRHPVGHSGAGEFEVPVGPGAKFVWQATPPRRCIGLWQPDRRRRLLCPHRQRISDTGAGTQCTACTAADPGRALARDQAVDDDRRFVLYLAWFGAGLVKVGLTAAERGADRLAEQGALAYTGLASGPLIPIRRAERQIAAAGLAREHLTSAAKIPHWWALPPRADRCTEVQEAHHRIHTQITWPPGASPLTCRVHDQAAMFGLDRPLPPTYRMLTGLLTGGALAGQVIAVAGRHLLLDTDAGPVLTDTRLLAGWGTPQTVDGPTRHIHLGPAVRTNSGGGHDQPALF
jgi:hypothetical protein